MSQVLARSDFEDTTSGGVVEASQSARQAAEVQSAMVIAKRFPRDQIAAKNRIIQACQRIKLAEASMYSYPRGGQQVTGPSIRLAEAMAQNWGNLDFGIIELDQNNGHSSVMAYCVDLETNTRQVKTFTVPHVRHTRNGSKALTDPRDIYEMVANQGARRLRSCILGIIPGDVKDSAIEQCEKTISTGSGEPLVDRVTKMVSAFADMGVTQEMMEKRLGHKIEVTNETEFVSLRKIFTSLRDGMSKREQWFEFEPAKQVSGSDLSEIGNEPPEQTTEETIGFFEDRIKEAESEDAINDILNQLDSELAPLELKPADRKKLTKGIDAAAKQRHKELTE